MKLTKNQKLIINKIENILNIFNFIDKCEAINSKTISYKFEFITREEKRNYTSFLKSNLHKYNFCKFEDGGNDIIIKI